jgi:hypothetical protein
MGHGIVGVVPLLSEPQLMDKESQLLFWLIDNSFTVVQVRFILHRLVGSF